MRLKKRYIGSLLLILILFAAAVFMVENVLPYTGIKPFRMSEAVLRKRMPKGILPEDYGLKGHDVSFKTKDSIWINTYLLDSNLPETKATVIILHGIGACKETQLGRARILADAGIATAVLDLRAHGRSGGEYCTFGYCEKNDIHDLVDRLLVEHPERPVGIWGISLGGAIALQEMGMDPRIRFGIIESTFDEFEKVAVEYGADFMFGLRSKWLTDRVLAKSGQIAHFDPDMVKPVVSAQQIHVPVLFMHGDNDDKIPIEFNRRNFEAVASPDKQWITVSGADHLNVWQKGGDALEQRVQHFLKQQVRDQAHH